MDEIIEIKFERYCNSRKNLTLKDIHSFQGINLMGSRLTGTRLTYVTRQQAFFIGALSGNKCIENEWYINLKVKSDTGAQCNVIQKAFLRKGVLFVKVKRGQDLFPMPVMK